MKLAYWMYAGPAHIGVLRVTSSFKNVHAIMHAPLGDDYFNVMRSMLERERDFTPVTASIVDRHVLARGSQEKVVENIIRKNKEESPDLILLTPTCTSSILQEDLHNFVERSTLSLTGVNTIPPGVSSNVAIDEVQVNKKLTMPNTTEQSSSKLTSFTTSFAKNFVENSQPQSNIRLAGSTLNQSSSNSSPEQSSALLQSKSFNKEHDSGWLRHGLPELKKGTGSKNDAIVTEPSLDSKQTDKLEQSPDVILADVNHYRVNELQAADRTLEQIVRYYIEKAIRAHQATGTLSPVDIDPAQNLSDRHASLNSSDNYRPYFVKTEKPSVNIIGIFTLGFHNQHDCRELKRLFNDLGITINEIIPEGGNVNNLKNLPKAWFNFVPYREIGLMTAMYLKSEFNMPYVSITPMGLVDTALCIREIGQIISKQLTKDFFRQLELSSGKNLTKTTYIPKQSLTAPEFHPLVSLDFRTLPANDTLHQSDVALRSEPELCQALLADPLGQEGSPANISPGKVFTDSVKNQANTQCNQDNSRCSWAIENLFNKYIDQQTRFVSQAAWFSRSIDCQNLTGKKAVVFGDATHAAAMTKILAREMGIRVSCAGTYCKHDADWFREQVTGFCDQILITDDHTQVGDTIAKLEPAAIFGTQMERHVGKRLDIPCGVISAPVHIQNFPLGYRPFLGYEGTNQIADLVYNSFNLGMEDHLLQIFGGHDSIVPEATSSYSDTVPASADNYRYAQANLQSETSKPIKNLWSPESLAELNKVPGFVRGKVKRNTEKYALQNNISLITVEVMYAAKEALSN